MISMNILKFSRSRSRNARTFAGQESSIVSTTPQWERAFRENNVFFREKHLHRTWVHLSLSHLAFGLINSDSHFAPQLHHILILLAFPVYRGFWNVKSLKKIIQCYFHKYKGLIEHNRTLIFVQKRLIINLGPVLNSQSRLRRSHATSILYSTWYPIWDLRMRF